MPKYDPALSHFDLDLARGQQGEMFVQDVAKMLADGSGRIEVKRDSWYPLRDRFYVEKECLHADGVWHASGIMVTRAILWAFVWGAHGAMTVIPTDWLRRAEALARLNPRNITPVMANYGKTPKPTRGTYVYERHLLGTRDTALDEH